MSTNLTWKQRFALDLATRDNHLVALETAIMILINFTAAFGNVLVCYVIYKTPGLRTRTNLYIIALAVSDVLQACLGMPFTLVVLIKGRWIFSDFACRFQGFWILFLGFVSLHTMALTAVNRYLCVVRPQLYRRWCNKKSFLTMQGLVWIFAFVSVVIPQVTQIATFRFQANRAACFVTLSDMTINIAYTIYSLFCFVLLPLCVISGSYFKVFSTIRQHKANIGNSVRQVSVEELQVTNMLFALVIGFGACWIPAILVEMLDSSLPRGLLPRSVYMMYIYLGYLSSAINPVLYSVMNRAFRRASARVFVCCRTDSNAVTNLHVQTRRTSGFILRGTSTNHEQQTTAKRENK